MHVMEGVPGGVPLPDLPTFEPSNVAACFRAIPVFFNALCTLLHSCKTQLFSSQAFPHSLQKTTRGGGDGHLALNRNSGRIPVRSLHPYFLTYLAPYVFASLSQWKQHRLGGRTIGDGLEFRKLPPERF